jgi:hypothetical protein
MRIKNFGLNLKLVEKKTRRSLPAQMNWRAMRVQAKKDFRDIKEKAIAQM